MYPHGVARPAARSHLTPMRRAPHKAGMKTIFAICGICIIG
jgi:hypothetical protein